MSSTDERYAKAFAPWFDGPLNRRGETRAFCPNCEKPGVSRSSASFMWPNEVWHCMSCGEGGSFRALLRNLKARDFALAGPKWFAKQSAKDEEPPPDNVTAISGDLPTMKQVRLWHKDLLRRKPQLKKMTEDRGLSIESLKKHLIGYNGSAYTIPIYGEGGELVNVRLYRPNARDHKNKMRSYKAGTGTARIDGHDTLEKHDSILLCEGEMDRRVALQHGLPAVTHTGGASTFKLEWAKHFKGKIVYVAYDEDQAGNEGAQKVTKVLRGVADAVYRVKLNTGINGGDVTDFFVMGRTKSDMVQCMESATPLYVGEAPHKVPKRGKRVSIQESMSVTHKEPLELTVMVAGKIDPPYTAPRKIVGTCDMSAGPKCAVCPFAIDEGKRVVEFLEDDERILKFIDQSESRQHELMCKFTEAKCRTHVTFETPEEWDIEEMWVLPSMDHRTEEIEDPKGRLVYSVGTFKTPVNQPAKIVGVHTKDHRNSRGMFHGWHTTPVQTDLDSFKMTPEIKQMLLKFRPSEGQSPLQKCMEIAEDMSANVTRIYGRPMLHVGYDLTWHSLTSFVFEGKPVTKGWLECLVLGDTRTGKSETAAALAKHYQAGTVKPLEGSTLAGLVGSVSQPAGKSWMVTWGLIPLNDRRLVVLDEMSGLFAGRESKGIIEEMSSIRSEGKAQITKAAAGETSARTRLIWISNPIDARSLAESPDGCIPALQRLVKQPEDIARFDYVMAVTGKDVPSSIINSTKHTKVKHKYDKKSCHELLMWAWSRRTDQVKFLTGVEEYLYAAAEDLGSRYDPDPPLIQIANARVKVARLAVAFAARTFSTDRSGECVVVKRAHVKSAVEFLDAIYGEPSMGYKRRSEKAAADRRKAEKSKVEARKWLRENPDIIEAFIAVSGETFRPKDFEELGNVDKITANETIGMFAKWRLIVRGSQGKYRMQPALYELLNELEEDEGD